jgi:hypothetical protein
MILAESSCRRLSSLEDRRKAPGLEDVERQICDAATADVLQFMGAKLSRHISHNFPLAAPRAQKRFIAAPLLRASAVANFYDKTLHMHIAAAAATCPTPVATRALKRVRGKIPPKTCDRVLFTPALIPPKMPAVGGA